MYLLSFHLYSGSEYQDFKILSVANYVKPAPTPWYRTETGIIVISFCVLGLIFVMFASVMLTWYYGYYRPKKRYINAPLELVNLEAQNELISFFDRHLFA